ncbi:tyrosine-type recombinase/integrase [Salipiger sp.]|uniref:tyrosine-type recombinase/integrase n=1 Tax=Salipiger sp. TaxID=2078585 RepID=UPI003A9773ED
MTIYRRGNTYHLRKRVPLRYGSVEDRKIVGISLHTDSASVARTKSEGLWQNLIEGWEAKLAGDTSDAERRFEAARELAAVRGFRYLPATKASALPTEEWLARVEAVPERNGRPDMKESAALLGGVEEPPITVTRALELYWGLAADRSRGKSEDQLRRWKNPRKKAVANFIAQVGDKPLAEITGDDMLAFRDWWIEKLEEDGLTANSANKDLIHLGDVLKTVNRMKRLGLVLPLTDLSLKEGEAQTRPPFSTDWIRDKLLAPGALEGLNTEARCIVLGMVNTGYRPSEGAALTAATIRLDHKVPHISIEPDGRQLKSQYARRVIPLAGVSLEAFKECSQGFPRYKDKPGLSATVNKYLRANGLMESPKHVLYSLRHSFEDRMLAAGVDDRIRRDVFGHRLTRERYGKGASLAHLLKVVQQVAL